MTCFLIVCQFGMFLGLSDMYFEQLGMLSLTLLLYMSAKFIVCLFVARSQHMYCLWQVQMYRIFISYSRFSHLIYAVDIRVALSQASNIQVVITSYQHFGF